jgi:hypothetical protein
MSDAPDPATCRHEQHESAVRIHHFVDTGRWNAEIQIRCLQCKAPFRFLGIAAGLSWEGPTCSVEGEELRIPIEPAPAPRLVSPVPRQPMPPGVH